MRVALWLLTALVVATPSSAAAQAAVSQVHLTFASDSRHGPANSIVVSWRARTAEPGRIVLEDARAVAASARPLPDGGWLHHALVAGLEPGARHRYTIRTAEGSPAFTGTFETPGPLPLRFTATADIGVTRTSRAIVARAAALRPHFHLACGDLSYANATQDVQGTINRWMDLIEPLASAAAFMPAWGNHEYTRPDRVEHYLARFVLPNNGKWYSFDAGPVHVTVLTSRMEPFRPGSAQYEWLERDLAAADRTPAIAWKVVCFHHPPFSSGLVHASDLPTREAWAPLFDRYGVDLVLTGHDHAYERTYPVTADGAVRARGETFVDPGAPVYVVTGGGGQSIYGLAQARPAWSAMRAGAYHVSAVTIEDASRLRFEMVRADGTVGDRFVIVKRR